MGPDVSKNRNTYLNIVSVFPALTETFVLREIQTMQHLGHAVIIGQLRTADSHVLAPAFEHLRPFVVRARLLSWSTLAGILFFGTKRLKCIWTYLRLVLTAFPDLVSTFKLAYILLASLGLAYRLRRSGLTHVRGHHLHSEAVAAMFIAGLLEIPYSFTCHTVRTYYPRSVLAPVVHRAKFILANILQVSEFLYSLGAGASQINMVRNGVSLEQFPVRTSEPAEEPALVLAVGRLDYKKGFHVLLSACAILRDEGVAFRCVIVGDGDEKNQLLVRRKALGLEGRVDMAGSLAYSNVQRLYERASLMVVPSVVAPDGSTDGLPTVIIEAFANGVPVVASATAGIPEVIQNGVNGFVVPAGSPRELAARMRELLSDPDLRRKFALEARHTAERDFDLDRNLKSLSELLSGRNAETETPGGISLVAPAFDGTLPQGR